MNKRQEEEWNKAQQISIEEDLIEAAQRELEFLAAVDRQRWLYSSAGVERAIYRYKTCWLPLLAKHSANGDMKAPLVVPLDCEWIWHCHRLNPLQYKMDCERIYGRIFDCNNVESSIRSRSKAESKELWTRLYPAEPFELDNNNIAFVEAVDQNAAAIDNITYDLVAAVQRQSSFYYEVPRPGTQDPRFLAEALKRYKGFLYLIKSNQEKSIKSFSVPTYDIDIIWHSHQLCPVSYYNDMMSLLGMVLQHDDTDSDRSMGSRMRDGFVKTTKQFEETFGLRYWRAGAMYRGNEPTPLTTVPVAFDSFVSGEDAFKSYNEVLSVNTALVVQIFLEIVDVKDEPMNESEILYVSFTKNQPDLHFGGTGTLSIQSLTGKKCVAGFECEPAGEITLTLIAKSKTNSYSDRVLGIATISLNELTGSDSKFLIDKWFELKSNNSKLVPISLRVAASSNVPESAPIVLNLLRPKESFLSSLCGFFFPLCGKQRNTNYWTNIVDYYGQVALSVQMRYTTKQKNSVPEFEVVGITGQPRKPVALAVGSGNKWLFNEICNLSCKVEIKENENSSCLCELKGDHVVKNEWFVLAWITLSSIIMNKLGREINSHASNK